MSSQVMSQPTEWCNIRKRLHMKPYRLQLLQALSAQDHNLRTQICISLQEKLQEDGFAEKVILLIRPPFMHLER